MKWIVRRTARNVAGTADGGLETHQRNSQSVVCYQLHQSALNFYESNTFYKFTWKHGKTLPVLFNDLETLTILIVLKRSVFVCLNTIGRSVYKLNLNHDCHLNSTSGIRFQHMQETLRKTHLQMPCFLPFFQRRG